MFPDMGNSKHDLDRDRLSAWLAGGGRYVVTVVAAVVVVGMIVMAVTGR